jgi:hypothetical protein
MDYDDIFGNVLKITLSDIRGYQTFLADLTEIDWNEELKKAKQSILEIHPYVPDKIMESMVTILFSLLRNITENAYEIEKLLKRFRMTANILDSYKHHVYCLQTVCIDTDFEYYQRFKVLSDFERTLTRNRHAFICSPSGTGKTSLIKLYQTFSATSKFVFININFNSLEDSFTILKKAGYDYREQTVSGDLFQDPKKVFVFVLDDAHTRYDDEEMWFEIIKYSPVLLAENIKFIISVDYRLSAIQRTPIDFYNLPEISKDMLLLDKIESREFLESPMGLINAKDLFKTLVHIVIYTCDGIIAALRIASYYLNKEFMKFRMTGLTMDEIETKLIQFFYSAGMLRYMSRCFLGGIKSPENEDVYNLLLKMAIVPKCYMPLNISVEDSSCIAHLKRLGVIEENFGSFKFTSLLAKRFYLRYMNRIELQFPPESLAELVRVTLSKMSASALKAATNAKKAVFAIFFEALVQSMPSYMIVCPDLSRSFPRHENTDDVVAAEAFYINGKLQWGILVSVDGGKKEDAFNYGGQYHKLGLLDYMIVDFCFTPDDQGYEAWDTAHRIKVRVSSDFFEVSLLKLGSNESERNIILSS